MSHMQQDEEGNWVQVAPPSYQTNLWDMGGIVVTTVAGLLFTLGQGLNLVAREAFATAEWTRAQKTQRKAIRAYEEHQRRMAADLEKAVGFQDPS